MNKPNLFCTVTSDVDEFKSLRPRWNILAGLNPLLSWEWLYSWWNTFHQGNQLLIILVRDERRGPHHEGIVGIVPWYKTVTPAGSRVVRCLGDGEACSDYQSVICQEPQREEIENCLAATISQSPALKRRLARWDYIEIEGHGQQHYQSFFAQMQRQGCRLFSQPLEGCWVAQLGSSFPEFEAAMHKSFRRKVKKARQNLEHPDIEFELIDSGQRLPQVWPSFCNLHQKRRQMLGDSGCFSDARFEQFLFDATSRLIDTGRARLACARARGQDIGFVLAFYGDEGCYMYQSGMEPQASRWEPGHMMTTALIRQCIADGLITYDFLRGDERYKRFWNTTRQPLYKTRVVAAKTTARLRHQIWLAGRHVKHGLATWRLVGKPTAAPASSPN